MWIDDEGDQIDLGAEAKDLYEIKCVFPYWTGFAPTFLARDLGYFEEEGLKVDIVFDDDRGNVLPDSAVCSNRRASQGSPHGGQA